jgi:general L-amino acid transport system permease protein
MPLATRDLLLQLALILMVIAFLTELAANVAANMARLHIHAGFRFLQQPAGFDIAQTLISYSQSATYLRVFWVALLNTILVSAAAIAGASVLGLAVALARLSTNPLLSLVAGAYVEAGRNIPLLLQLFFWYFAVLVPLPLPRRSLTLLGIVFLNKRGLFLPVPVLQTGFSVFAASAIIGVGAALALAIHAHRRRINAGRRARQHLLLAIIPLAIVVCVAWIMRPVTWDIPAKGVFNVTGGIVLIPEFVALAIGLAIYGSAFVAELVRAGILAVGRGQTDAAQALGLSRARIYASVVIPQAMRIIVPPLTSEYTSLIKNSSLAAAIGYPDLMMIFGGTVLNQTGQPLETMVMTMASYLALCIIVSRIGQSVNRRLLRAAL